MLEENGKIIFIEPNIFNPYCTFIFKYARKWANLEPDEMAFSRRFIIRKLKKFEFKNIRVVYKDFVVPGVPDILIQPLIVLGDII